MPGEPLRHERYQMGEAYTQQIIGQREAQEFAGFLLPHLRPGMRVLDAGCGPGTITLGLATIVTPGEVVGIDLRETDLERGRVLAMEQGLTNVRFEAASIYALPFPDASFDAAFASLVFQHLGDQLAACRELRRVLKPGGVVGIGDPALDGVLRYPSNPQLDAVRDLRRRASTQRGGHPSYAPTQRALLRRAGFAQTEGQAWVVAPGTLEATRRQAQEMVLLLRGTMGPVALAQGWATQDDIDAMADAVIAWGEDPDAFMLIPYCGTLGWA